MPLMYLFHILIHFLHQLHSKALVLHQTLIETLYIQLILNALLVSQRSRNLTVPINEVSRLCRLDRIILEGYIAAILHQADNWH